MAATSNKGAGSSDAWQQCLAAKRDNEALPVDMGLTPFPRSPLASGENQAITNWVWIPVGGSGDGQEKIEHQGRPAPVVDRMR
jgi:hypothetical protein